MDFAANAVSDVFAPQPRATLAREPASGEQSFNDHLDAANAEDAPVKSSAKPVDAEKTTDTEDTADTEATPPLDAAPAPGPPPQPQATAHVVQIVDAAPVETETPNIAPSAPVAPPTDTAPQPTATAPEPAPDAKQASPSTKADDATASDSKSVATPAVESAATPTTPTTPTPNAAVAPVQAASAMATEQPAPQAIATSAAPVQPATRESAPAPRAAKSTAPRVDTKEAPPTFSAQDIEEAAANEIATPRNAGKSAPAAKDFVAPAPISTQEAPTPTPPQAASVQTSAPLHQGARIEHAAPTHATPAATQVAHEIVRRFNGESTRFELRLDPAELGRVDVRLEVSRDNRVTATIAADSPQALTELVRHARELEQTLQSAGLELSDGGLSFDLRQGGEGREDANEALGGANSSRDATDDTTQQTTVAARPLGFERWRGVRVDVRV